MIPVESLGSALVHFLWQGALLALVAWLALSTTRRPQLRYLIGTVTLGLMPVGVVLTLLAGDQPSGAPTLPEERRTVGEGPLPRAIGAVEGDGVTDAIEGDGATGDRGLTGPAALPPAAVQTPGVLYPLIRSVVSNARAIVTVWVAGVLLISLRLLFGLRFTSRLLRSAVPASRWLSVVDRLRDRLGISRAARVLESAVATTPVVIGWLRPVILLPVSALSGLTPRQIELVIAHELAHVARHDYLVNLIQSAIEALLFFHPAVWWLSRRVREEREVCCDDLAIRATGDPRELAEALYALERLRGPALAPGAAGGNLVFRIRRLVDPNSGRHETLSRWAAGALVILVLTATGLGGHLSRLTAAVPPVDVPLTAPVEPMFARIQTSGSGEPAENVTPAPDRSRPLAERMAWARGEGDRRGDRAYWVVYTIQPLAWTEGSIYIGGEATMVFDNGDVMSISGVLSIGDSDRLVIDGTPLSRIFDGKPGDAAVILGFRGWNRPTPGKPVVASLSLAHEFEDLPIYWLGPAADEESIALAREHFRGARTSDEKKAFVRLIGVHGSSDLVVPELLSILGRNEPSEVRSEAVEWLGRHPRMEALRALDVAARTDRSSDVRREAAEAVGEMNLPEAFEVLRKLAIELDSTDPRREAVESFGKRPEAEAARVLHRIALEDSDEDIRREAVETLGDFEDGRGGEALLDLLENSPYEDVRAEAAETVGEVVTPSRAIPELTRVVKEDPSEIVRYEALEGLVEMQGGKGIKSALELAGRSRDPELRATAIEKIAPELPADDAIRWLGEVIENDDSPRIRREAVETLGELEDRRALAVLTEMAGRHPDQDVRQEAVETLGNYPEDALNVFRRLLEKEESENVLAEIFETALELEDPDGVTFVRDQARHHPDQSIREMAADALKDY